MDIGPVLSQLPPLTPRLEVEGTRFGRRALSYILDLLLVNVAGFSVGFVGGTAFVVVLYFTAALFGHEPVFAEPSSLVNFILGILVSFAYFISFEALCGATPGKFLLRMRVATLDGDRPTLHAASVRALWRLIDGLFFGLIAASSMTPPLRQRYGDKRAKTLVVSSSSPILRYALSVPHFLLAALIFLLASVSIQILLLLAYVTFRPVP